MYFYKERYGNYWSSSRVADWIRGVPRLKRGTSAEWRAWREEVKKTPIRAWLAEELLDILQDICYFPLDVCRSFRIWFIDRFITKTYLIKTTLKKDQFNEAPSRLLYGAFQVLCDFIEIEKASMYVHTADEEERKNIPFKYRSYWFRWRPIRSEEYALKYLKWESWLDKTGGNLAYSLETSSSQAKDAQESIALYTWWKDRANRPDPHDVSGYDQLLAELSSCTDREKMIDIQKRKNEALVKVRDMQERYDKEDETMLLRLIKIRQSLWT